MRCGMLPGSERLVGSLQECAGHPGRDDSTRRHALYADARLYGERGIHAVLYGAGPRTVPESNAKKADERLALDDLHR